MATNLEFINSFEITSSTSAFNCDNIFSADYDVYEIYIRNLATVGTLETSLYFRFIDSGGSVINGTTYDYAYLNMKANTSFLESRSTTASFIRVGSFDRPPEGSNGKFVIYNPYDSSSYTFLQAQASVRAAGIFVGYKAIGVEHTAQSVRGIQILEPNVRPFDEGNISVYGVKG